MTNKEDIRAARIEGIERWMKTVNDQASVHRRILYFRIVTCTVGMPNPVRDFHPLGGKDDTSSSPPCLHDSDKLVGPTCREVGTLEANHRVGIQTVDQGRHPYRSTPGLVRRLQ